MKYENKKMMKKIINNNRRNLLNVLSNYDTYPIAFLKEKLGN